MIGINGNLAANAQLGKVELTTTGKSKEPELNAKTNAVWYYNGNIYDSNLASGKYKLGDVFVGYDSFDGHVQLARLKKDGSMEVITDIADYENAKEKDRGDIRK